LRTHVTTQFKLGFFHFQRSNGFLYLRSLQENTSLVIKFSDQKLLVTKLNNLDTNLKNKKLLVTKICHYYK